MSDKNDDFLQVASEPQFSHEELTAKLIKHGHATKTKDGKIIAVIKPKTSKPFKSYDVQVLGIDGIVGFVRPDSGLLMDLKKDTPLAQIRKDDILATPAAHHRKDLDSKKALVWSNDPVMRRFNFDTQEFEIVD